MYKISEVIKFIENSMENWWLELTAEEKKLAEGKIQSGIFQEDALSPLLFVIAMMHMGHILRKGTREYKLQKSQEKNVSSHVHGRHQSVCQKRKRIGNPNTGSVNILSGHRLKMCYAHNENRKTTIDWRLEQPNQGKNQNAWRIRYLQILENTGSGYPLTSGDARKKFKEYLWRTRKLLETK